MRVLTTVKKHLTKKLYTRGDRRCPFKNMNEKDLWTTKTNLLKYLQA